jgi:uncharacterized protein
MSVTLPPVVDAWRMVAARRCFEGELGLAEFSRLRGSLVDTKGECRFWLEFGRDEHGQAYVDVRVSANLPLQCQRTLARYLQPVEISQRLGLVTAEAQEAALPEGVEPVLVADSGELRPADLIEDELILALPVVPIDPDSSAPDLAWQGDVQEQENPHPFAALAGLKEKLKQ